jgi:hypothetical protein
MSYFLGNLRVKFADYERKKQGLMKSPPRLIQYIILSNFGGALHN